MGYVRERKNYRLVFTDAEFEGLEVVTSSASVAQYQRIAALSTKEYGTKPSVEDLEEIDALLELFGEHLVSWNLEEEVKGRTRAVPATAAGLKRQDLPFAMAIITAWMEAVAGIAVPLDSGSDGGGMEATLPMDVLSP
jgi:hypothetical protein